jgi:hypothetical protein
MLEVVLPASQGYNSRQVIGLALRIIAMRGTLILSLQKSFRTLGAQASLPAVKAAAKRFF